MGTFTAVDCREVREEMEPLALVRVPGHLLEILLMSACLPALGEVTERDAILSSASRRKLLDQISLHHNHNRQESPYERMAAGTTVPAMLESSVVAGWNESYEAFPRSFTSDVNPERVQVAGRSIKCHPTSQFAGKCQKT